MLARLSLWRMDSTLVRVLFFLTMSDFLCCLRLHLTQKVADEVLRIPRIGDFNEDPSPEAAVVVDSRHPQRARRGDFGSLIFLLLAGDFDDEAHEISRAVAVVDAGDEVGNVVLLLAIQRVRNCESEVV